MKKKTTRTDSHSTINSKLAVRCETLRWLRPLSHDELGDGRIMGGDSTDQCATVETIVKRRGIPR
jgi:hypothetical protein